jgi:hypothetical protein
MSEVFFLLSAAAVRKRDGCSKTAAIKTVVDGLVAGQAAKEALAKRLQRRLGGKTLEEFAAAPDAVAPPSAEVFGRKTAARTHDEMMARLLLTATAIQRRDACTKTAAIKKVAKHLHTKDENRAELTKLLLRRLAGKTLKQFAADYPPDAVSLHGYAWT